MPSALEEVGRHFGRKYAEVRKRVEPEQGESDFLQPTGLFWHQVRRARRQYLVEKALSLRSQGDLEHWLAKNHDKSNGVWLRIYKKGFGSNVLRGTEVLGPLLCYGWITGQARKGTKEYVLWWVCPRRKDSLWSKVNVGHAERLISEGKMKPSGLREVEEAKRDGRWDSAYPPQRTAALPSDFVKMVNRNRKAREFLKTLSKSDVYAIIFRLHNTKDPKRREEKMAGIINMLERGETFH